MGINTDYDQFERERSAISLGGSAAMITTRLDQPRAAVGPGNPAPGEPTQLDRIESLLVYIAEALTDDNDPDDDVDGQPLSTLDDTAGGMVHADDEP